MLKILIVSSEEDTLKEVQQALSLASYELLWARPGQDFISAIHQEKPRVLILKREGTPGQTFDLLKKIKEYDPLLEVIVLGKPESPARVAKIIGVGARDYFSWPLDSESLTGSLKKLEEKISIRQETFQLEKELASKYVFENMVSRNARMLEIFSLVERLAKHQITVLITGETGTGKELAARAVHNLSPRRQSAFIVVDCAAFPESLFESEVFGYERGAFTGADRSRPGLLKEADRGTIFFDEISEMRLSSQAKVLRFLSEGTFKPLGTNRPVKVDVRVICATNRDLREEVKKGRFREDLFHRINVAEINLPPLRRRKEDIHLLCLYFLDRYNQKFGREVRGVSNRVKKIFADYDWPGNIRELEKVIERGVMLTVENFIDVYHLPDALIKAAQGEIVEEGPYPYAHLTLAELEKKHVLEVLKAVDFNKQKAAKMLGITRPALYRRLKRCGLKSQ
jgi:DNA-binding NtrC family response regulator